MKPSESRAFRIHDHEVVPSDGRIHGPGGEIPVPAEAMATLVRLAEAPGQIVAPEALCGDAPDRDALDARIRELRAALGGSPDSNRLIESLGDAGYRLVAPVAPAETSWFHQLSEKRVFRAMASYGVAAWLVLQIVDVLSGALPVPNWTMTAATVAVACGFPIAAIVAWTFQITPAGIVLDTGNGGGRVLRRLAHHFDIAVIALLLALVAFLSWGRVFATASPEQRFALAVLPFENLSGDPGDQYLSDGIVDDIRSRLLDVPQLLVAAGRSSRELANQGLDVREIGTRLNVDHLLEGSLRRSGESIRVTLQLVDVESGFNRWSTSYSTSVDRLLALESDIALVVASELELLLSRELRQIISEAPTDDAIAHGLFLQAREAFQKPRTEANLAAAQNLFEEVIARDPRFGLAHSGLCRTLVERYEQSGDTAFVTAAEQRCPRALALGRDSSDAHAALGELFLVTGRVDDAEREFEAAITLNARAIPAQVGLADTYARQRRFADAETQYLRAIDMLPGNWLGYYRYAVFLLGQGRLGESIRTLERVIELTPRNANALSNLAVAHMIGGDLETASSYLDQSLAIDTNRANYSNFGTIYYFNGQYDRAVSMYRLAAAESANDYRMWGNLADAQRFVADERDAASDNYRRAIELATDALAIDPAATDTMTNLAWYYANLDDAARARALLQRAADTAAPNFEEQYVRGITFALLGDDAAAAEAVGAALDAGYPRFYIEATPELRDRGLVPRMKTAGAPEPE